MENRVTLVTGAGGGMGREHALALARHGDAVVVNDVNAEAAMTTADQIRSSGGHATASCHDIADALQATALVQQAVDEFGGLHAVVSNAGIISHSPFAQLSAETFGHVMSVNAFGAFNVLKAAWPLLLEQRHGRVVMVSSSSVFLTAPALSAYAASKGAVLGLAKSLSAEGEPFGVTVNVLAPTAYTAMSSSGPSAGDEHRRQQIESLLGAADVAPVVAWLTRASTLVNGQIIETAGGRVALNFMGSTKGYTADRLTVDLLDDHLDEVTRREGHVVMEHIGQLGPHLIEAVRQHRHS